MFSSIGSRHECNVSAKLEPYVAKHLNQSYFRTPFSLGIAENNSRYFNNISGIEKRNFEIVKIMPTQHFLKQRLIRNMRMALRQDSMTTQLEEPLLLRGTTHTPLRIPYTVVHILTYSHSTSDAYHVYNMEQRDTRTGYTKPGVVVCSRHFLLH